MEILKGKEGMEDMTMNVRITSKNSLNLVDIEDSDF